MKNLDIELVKIESKNILHFRPNTYYFEIVTYDTSTGVESTNYCKVKNTNGKSNLKSIYLLLLLFYNMYKSDKTLEDISLDMYNKLSIYSNMNNITVDKIIDFLFKYIKYEKHSDYLQLLSHYNIVKYNFDKNTKDYFMMVQHNEVKNDV